MMFLDAVTSDDPRLNHPGKAILSPANLFGWPTFPVGVDARKVEFLGEVAASGCLLTISLTTSAWPDVVQPTLDAGIDPATVLKGLIKIARGQVNARDWRGRGDPTRLTFNQPELWDHLEACGYRGSREPGVLSRAVLSCCVRFAFEHSLAGNKKGVGMAFFGLLEDLSWDDEGRGAISLSRAVYDSVFSSLAQRAEYERVCREVAQVEERKKKRKKKRHLARLAKKEAARLLADLRHRQR